MAIGKFANYATREKKKVVKSSYGLTWCLLPTLFFCYLSIPNGFEYELLTKRQFFQDQDAKCRNSGAITRLCNADIDKMGSSKWVTLKCAGYNSNAQLLDEYLWNKRVIIVNANTNSVTQGEQEKTLLWNKAELKERKIVILRYDDGIITQRYPDAEIQYKNQDLGIELTGEDRFLLIGLDGGIKYRSHTVKSHQWIFDFIDSMPMRQNELKRKQKKE